MTYAATRSTVKTLFGSQYIQEELFGTVPEDISLNGYDKHTKAAAAPPPLSMAEIEKKEVRAAETGVDIGTRTKKSSCATGVFFPLTPEATEKLQALKAGDLGYVQLKVDLANEVITLAIADNADADAAGLSIPNDQARYNIINFKHNHEGDSLESIVFAYSCPGFKLPIKERMMYASCKGPLTDTLEQDLGFVIAAKMEITDGSEFTKEALYEQLHPTAIVFKQKFARPKPAGKQASTSMSRPRRKESTEEEPTEGGQ